MEHDLTSVMQIWLDTNIKTHNFISKEYWSANFGTVKNILPQAEIYVYENDTDNTIAAFIGLTENYIEGIFVREDLRSQGIGKQLLDHVKVIKPALSLNVYQQNVGAIRFYKREGFSIRSETIDENTNEKEFCMIWSK